MPRNTRSSEQMETVSDVLQVEKGKLTPGKDESGFEAYEVVVHVSMEKCCTRLFES